MKTYLKDPMKGMQSMPQMMDMQRIYSIIDGSYVNVAAPVRSLSMLWTLITSSKKIIVSPPAEHIGSKKEYQNLIYLKELIETGKIKAVLDRTYPFKQTAEAHRYVD